MVLLERTGGDDDTASSVATARLSYSRSATVGTGNVLPYICQAHLAPALARTRSSRRLVSRIVLRFLEPI